MKFFTPEHFKYYTMSDDGAVIISEVANALLHERLLSKAVRVFGHCWDEAKASDGSTFGWGQKLSTTDTHQALLIDVREIERECAEHEPDLNSVGKQTALCKHCGKLIVPTKWELG